MRGFVLSRPLPQAAIVLSLCLLLLSPVSILGASTPTARPTAIEVDCAFDPLPVEVTCYHVDVPGIRSINSSPPISLFVAILKSSSSSPMPDPVVYLEGGPGEAASDSVVDLAQLSLLAQRDLILLDQRGTGRSMPVLLCPEMDAAVRLALTVNGLSPIEELDGARSSAASCAERLKEEGIALDSFNSAETARDVVDVLSAFEIDQWNMYGVSYGTRAALAVLRDTPSGVRSVILDSGSPPDEYETRPTNLLGDFEAGFDHFFLACASDEACANAFPNLEEAFDTVIARFDEAPYRVEVMLETETGSVPSTLDVTGADLFAVLGILLKEEEFIPLLPALIGQLADGRSEPLDELITPLIIGGVLAPGLTAFGTQFSVDCADQPPAFSERDDALMADPGFAATLLLFASGTYCADWNVQPISEADRLPVSSDVPTLLIAGAFDPISLPLQTQQAGAALTQATYVELPASGHVPSLTNACAASLVDLFLDDPRAALDTACLEQEGPPDFLAALTS